MKRLCLALSLIMFSLFCSYAQDNSLSVLFNSWLVYDEALEKIESCKDANSADLSSAADELQSAKFELLKNLYKEKEIRLFKIENIFFGFRTEFDELIEAVQKDNRHLAARKISNYIFIRSEMLSNSGKTYATLLVLLSLMMAAVIAFVVFYQITFSRAQESETTLEITMNAQEAERNRLSQELHDSVAQEMRYVSMLADEIPHGSPQKQIADEIKERQKNCIEDIRAICYNLSPVDIERKNLGGALEFLCESFMKRSGISTKLTIADGVDFSVFSKEQMHNIFRIVQELLSNIQKYAAASEVTVFARNANERDGKKEGVCFFVSDDGNGFFKQNKDEAHFGIRSINARLKTLGAVMEYKGIENQGTDVKIYIPLSGGGTRRWILS